MRFPDFLIIGAMKAGTTTLWADLSLNPQVKMAARKEPHDLIHEAVLTPKGRRAYASYFRGAGPDDRCGEASTGYTKLPDFQGVVERARRLLPPHAKFIYVVREPVARIVSHHHHALAFGAMAGGIDDLVRSDPRLLNWTRYAMQAGAWIDAFGPERVRIVRFEDYIADRPGVVDELSRFIGVAPRGDLVDPSRVMNKGEERPVSKGVVRWVRDSWAYKRVLFWVMPTGLRKRLRSGLAEAPPPKPPPPTRSTAEYIYDELSEDLERLRVMMGLDHPVWDRERGVSKYGGSGSGSPAGRASERSAEGATGRRPA